MRDELRVLVRRHDGKRQIAALKGGRLTDYLEEEREAHSLAGAVILGLVERVLPSLGAAFVKIGQPENGFLPLTEMEGIRQSGNLKPLMTGQEALVQVKKDARGEKGAFLSRDIALPGLYCVLMPLSRHVGVSGRVRDAAERERLLAMGRTLAEGRAGLIMRHAALEAGQADMEAEMAALWALWAEIREKAGYAKPPSVLYREPSQLAALLRDHAARHCLQVFAEEENRPELPQNAGSFTPQTALELEALWQGARVQEQLREALGRRVPLPGGGSLVIDEGEALTAIDVNTGSFTGVAGESAALAQNLAATEEIARQIRLRNLGGIILADFIDMETEAEREQVREAMEAALAPDRVRAVVHGFTRLGLLEMTRRRTRESLRERLTEPCGACRASGRRLRENAMGKEPIA